MAFYHKLTVIGKVVRDPEVRTFANGGKVAKIGLPINFTQRKKNPQTGEWEGPSFIIDVDVFNRENGAQLADIVQSYVKKGSQVFIEGRLKPNEYTDRNGVKTFKPVLVADTIKLLDARADYEEGSTPSRANAAPAASRKPAASPAASSASPYDDEPADGGGEGPPNEETIPF